MRASIFHKPGEISLAEVSRAGAAFETRLALDGLKSVVIPD